MSEYKKFHSFFSSYYLSLPLYTHSQIHTHNHTYLQLQNNELFETISKLHVVAHNIACVRQKGPPFFPPTHAKELKHSHLRDKSEFVMKEWE